MTLVQHAPRFTVEDAAAIARECFGFEVRCRRAGAAASSSERDQNFRLCDAQGRQAVLKIANALEEYALLEAQNGALLYVAEQRPRGALPTAADGAGWQHDHGRDGRRTGASTGCGC